MQSKVVAADPYQTKPFRGLQFILDRPHLKEHLYEGVEAMELPENVRHSIVDAIVSLINQGKVQKIIKKFQNYQGTGAKEIETLANYTNHQLI